MFDLPTAKRVRRDEVQSPASSRSPSPADEAELQDAHDRLGKLLNLDSILGLDASQKEEESQQPAVDDEDDEQEFEFRLFSAPVKSKETTEKAPEEESSTKQKGSSKEKDAGGEGTQKLRIRLRSPTPISARPEDGRFVKAFRGWQYYFTDPTLYGLKDELDIEAQLSEKRRQYEDTAVTGDHITSWAKAQPWPGCDLSWRVIRLKRHQTKVPSAHKTVPVYVVEGAPPTKSPKTRKKPGKKRRVQLRKKVKAAEVAKENEAEKRTRKNRERKIKRRQKAREEKAAKAGETVDGDVAMADGDESSGGEE
ncbi:hypothetical protein N7509_010500 [Penicillium cosmopolitanum]|uniref:Uncharacterized protein n=1 Tax=Penicillium cosmopolitanum TaxID=1131564 RepID=A0A9W9VRR5_9EURO|nr:uncharacterized protein N7509_010500 [Penicillium cosmopolitanum]KAJ5387959.1 hypothetical protein N7509_010500 [Penicillium cosmopolitanum]